MSIRFKIFLVIEILTIILQGEIFFRFYLCLYSNFFLTNNSISFQLFIDPDFICADVSSSSLGKNSFNSFNDHPKWSFVSNVTTQIGTHAYLPCKVSVTKKAEIVRKMDLMSDGNMENQRVVKLSYCFS